MKLFTRLSTNYFFYYAIMGLVVPYLAVFLHGRGFSSVHIGEIIAIVTVSKIIGPSLWAVMADKTGKHVSIIRMGTVFALCSFMAIFWLESYWAITVCLTTFSLFWAATLPQIEVMSLHSINFKAHIYGRIRVWGSIGFIVFSILAGYFIDELSSEVFPYLVLVALLGLLASNALLKQPKVNVPHERYHTSILDKIICLPFMLFFISGLLLQVSFGAYYNFFVLLLMDYQYSGVFIGSLLGLAVLAEIFVFIFCGKLFKYFSLKALLITSLIFTAIRWLLIANFTDNIYVLIASQLLHALSFGVFHSASVQFISQHFTSNQQNRGQAIYIGGVFGLGAAIGAYIAGLMWKEGSGAITAFEVSAAIALCGAFLLLFLKPKSRI